MLFKNLSKLSPVSIHASTQAVVSQGGLTGSSENGINSSAFCGGCGGFGRRGNNIDIDINIGGTRGGCC
ncbi:hypothetical protein DFA_06255 [Cavenderia fasciculata]|uniref:Uncharacterized protein n=1 Tax=Cavenderia fasciculata TaxID=261658 RepID=F4PKJ2_CACFS|nr:uncharacterized protein DFA_06255 [Cavenderia fasciculata]EGG24116.1 hypothetical protein DFA_06255 [Cavenderia fasciculata]|eukprot:XP_004361967.1 hypothetical protein DFA_06255 [Cavenderia fasciculata]